MGVSETYQRGRRLLVERPGLAVVTVFGIVLLLDFFRRILVGDLPIATVLGYVWNGGLVGLIVGLAGIGLSLTYSILNFANFSHGDYLTTGAFTGWMVSYLVAGWGSAELGSLFLLSASPRTVGITVTSTPIAVILGLLVSIVATVAVAVLLDRIVYKPMREAGGISLPIASIGVALALRYVIVFIWSTSPRGLTAAGEIPRFRLDIGKGAPLFIDAHEVTLLVTSVALMFGVHLLLQRTKLGKAMRAMATNKDLARVTGIPTERVITMTWIIGAALAGSAGYLITLMRGTLAYSVGWVLLLLIFAAVILGGIGSIYGAMIGGIIIGVVRNVSLIWLPSDFSTAAAFLMMILILLFRPEGIFKGVKTA